LTYLHVYVWQSFFEKLAFIWPFSHLQIWPFFETACGQIWLFLFFGTWKTCSTCVNLSKKEGGAVTQHFFLSFTDVCLIRGLECDGWKSKLSSEKESFNSQTNFNLIKRRRRNHLLKKEEKPYNFENASFLRCSTTGMSNHILCVATKDLL
jgi:hypothetical protein